MPVKTKAIKLFLDNFQTALNKVERKTIYDSFLLELILEQHQKVKHAFEILTWLGEQRNFDNMYEKIYEPYEIASPNLVPILKHMDRYCLFFELITSEKIELGNRMKLYRCLKNDVLNIMAPVLIGTLFSTAMLAFIYLNFNVVLPVTLSITAIGASAILILVCFALYFYALEKYIQNSITKINTFNNTFTKTYNYDNTNAQLETSRALSNTTAQLSDDRKKITISTTEPHWNFFNNRENNGSSTIFESINTCYNSL